MEQTSDTLQSQYSVLAELKTIDDKAYRIRVDMERFPLEIEKLGETLKGRRAQLDAAKQAVEASEKKLRSSESELRDREDKLTKAEGKMMEVKTNEEYRAAMKENETQRSAKTQVEERVLVLLNDVEKQRTALLEIEKEFKAEEEKITAEQKVLQDECAKLSSSLDQENQKRTTICADLIPDVKDLYRRVSALSSSGTIVYADAGMCRGCNMRIRPQLYNEILGFRAVHRCGSCGRILILSTRSNDRPTEADAK